MIEIDPHEFREISNKVIRAEALVEKMDVQQRENTQNITLITANLGKLEHDLKNVRANIDGFMRLMEKNNSELEKANKHITTIYQRLSKYVAWFTGAITVGTPLINIILVLTAKQFGLM